LQYFLRSRKIDLRKSAVVNNYAFFHNVFLSILSLYMLLDCALHVYLDGGWSSIHGYLSLGFKYPALMNVFYWSKYLELIDTVILVLRNKDPGTLQLFHHCTTGSVAYSTRYHPLWIGTWTNGLIHIFMYAHFARPVSFIRRFITTAQIIQFLIVLISFNTWFLLYSEGVVFSDIMYPNFCYLVYLYFFILFFIDNYIKPKKAVVGREKQEMKKEQ